jgi:hypothetical protein
LQYEAAEIEIKKNSTVARFKEPSATATSHLEAGLRPSAGPKSSQEVLIVPNWIDCQYHPDQSQPDEIC